MRPLAHCVLAVLLLDLSGCTSRGDASPFTLRIAAGEPHLLLDPRQPTGWSVVMKDLVFANLVHARPDGTWASQVLAGWQRLGPGRFRLELLPGLGYHDGSAVSEGDLLASLQAMGLTAHEHSGWVELVTDASVERVEPLLVDVVLFKSSERGFLGTGPFRIAQQSPRSVLLERVKQAPGRVERVEFVGHDDSRRAFAAAIRQEANGLLMPDLGELELLDGIPHLQHVRGRGLHALTVYFNAARLNRKERAALKAALDPTELARAFGGDCVGTQSSVSGEALPAGRALSIVVDNRPAHVRVALAVGRALRSRAGEVLALALPEAQARLLGGDFDLFVAEGLAWPPEIAALYLTTGHRYNWFGYSNPELDAAVRQGNASAVVAALSKDPVGALVCRRDRHAALDARLQNVELGTYGILDSLPDWEVRP